MKHRMGENICTEEYEVDTTPESKSQLDLTCL